MCSTKKTAAHQVSKQHFSEISAYKGHQRIGFTCTNVHECLDLLLQHGANTHGEAVLILC